MDERGIAEFASPRFGWVGPVEVTEGPWGALGRIWRVDVGAARYAVKELFAEPPTEESIRAERDFARRAADVGVRVPTMHPDRDGRYLLSTAHGSWLRCSDWVDLTPIDPGAPGTPQRLGAMLAELHRRSPAADTEPNDGGPADPWYDRLPDDGEWAAARESGAPWVAPLDACGVRLARASAAVAPVTPERLLMCHRDLHPQNVFTDEVGTVTIIDCEDLGPAEPGRELARMAFDWFCDGSLDVDAVQAFLAAYHAADGPGRITEVADFSMLVASRWNFLVEQALLVLDPTTHPGHRARAQAEIEGFVRIMPTDDDLDVALTVARGLWDGRS